MLEVEVKVELLAPGALRRRLEQVAKPGPSGTQTDVFFTHLAASADETLRLRASDGALELTYKGPRLDHAAKVRVEENVRLADDPTALLSRLGWTPSARLVKHRETWHLDGATVCIDSIDGLGSFAEVEVLSDDAAAASKKVEELVKQLGLEGAQRHSLSYVEMAIAAGITDD